MIEPLEKTEEFKQYICRPPVNHTKHQTIAVVDAPPLRIPVTGAFCADFSKTMVI